MHLSVATKTFQVKLKGFVPSICNLQNKNLHNFNQNLYGFYYLFAAILKSFVYQHVMESWKDTINVTGFTKRYFFTQNLTHFF